MWGYRLMEEEYYRIHVWSNRCDYECFDFKEEFNKNVYEEQNFSLKFEIEVYTSETEKKVAYISGTLFGEDEIEEYGIDIIEAADYIDQDIYDSMCWLSKSKIFKDIDDEWMFNNPFSGYLATFYIYEEFRGKGIASYIFNNLNRILKYSLNINLRCLCTYPQPQKAEKWENIEDEDLKKIMIKTIKKCGFKAIGKDNYYAKKYNLI